MLTSATAADVLRLCENWRAGFYDVVLIIGGSLVIALSDQVKILLPFSRAPITGQTFVVLMIGVLFGTRRGSFAVRGTGGVARLCAGKRFCDAKGIHRRVSGRGF